MLDQTNTDISDIDLPGTPFPSLLRILSRT